MNVLRFSCSATISNRQRNAELAQFRPEYQNSTAGYIVAAGSVLSRLGSVLLRLGPGPRWWSFDGGMPTAGGPGGFMARQDAVSGPLWRRWSCYDRCRSGHYQTVQSEVTRGRCWAFVSDLKKCDRTNKKKYRSQLPRYDASYCYTYVCYDWGRSLCRFP